MPSAGESHGCCKPSSHDLLWWLLLLPLLFVVLLAGLYVVSSRAEHFAFLFGIAAFSIAYALHFFSVSSALCGVYIREEDEGKFNDEASDPGFTYDVNSNDDICMTRIGLN